MIRLTTKILATLLVTGGFVLAGCQDSVVNSNTDSSSASPTAAANAPGGANGSGQCDAAVNPGGSIQDAVDAASSGDVICVKPGTYSQTPTVNKDVTLRGGNAPQSSNPAEVDGWIEVTGVGATVERINVAPTTTYVPSNWSRPGSPFGILVTASDVSVKNNVVEGLTGDAAADRKQTISLNGIQVFGGDASNPLTGVVIAENVVGDLHNQGASGWSDLGGATALKVQGEVTEAYVRGNEVSNVHSAGWTWGLVLTPSGGPQGPPSGVVAKGNSFDKINEGAVYDVFADVGAAPYPGNAFGIDESDSGADDGNANGVDLQGNNFLEVPVGTVNKDTDETLDASCNYWGTVDGADDAIDADKSSAAAGEETTTEPWSVGRDGKGASCVGGSGPGNDPGPGNGGGPGQ